MKNNMPINDFSADVLRFGPLRVIVIVMLWACLHAGCALWPAPTRSRHVGETGPVGSCADFFASLDRQAAAADAVDAGYDRIQQYPYLRTDRFIASFRDDVQDDHAFSVWVDHMQAMDQSARRIEIAGLSDANMAALNSVDGRDALFRKVVACGNLLKDNDFSNVETKNHLRLNVSARDEYIPLRRVLGLYPITRVFVSQGITQWHADVRERFSLEPPTDGQALRYVSLASPDTRTAHRIIQAVERDELGIPNYTAEDRHTLFQAYAPIWEIETQSAQDRIGSPTWTDDGCIAVDTDRPQTYTHLSFTKFGNAVLTQLNYIIWLPSRPEDGMLDIYAGLLDGINFRVTLDAKGHPLLYETMHNCGCYYQAYPTRRLRVRETMDYAEPPLILMAPEMQTSSEMMVVGMEPRTHFVRHLYPLSGKLRSETVFYRLTEYDALKRLAYPPGNKKSMFDRYGLVPQSKRLERFILWPTGVLSPGAMRQWGRHAVAFVGKRHFDDPFYLDKMFVPAN